MGTFSDRFTVKQEIARLGLLPFPEFWAKSTRYGTPGPALLLHWIFSTVLIIICPLGSPNGYLIISTLFSYCRTLVGGEPCQTTTI
jgi:Amino acid permease